MYNYDTASTETCQPPLKRHKANPQWAEGVQLALGAQVGYCRHPKSYLRSYFIAKNPKPGPSTSNSTGNERRYTIWSPIKWVYEAPGIMRQVQQRLGWPTPNHLMTHYYRRYPHTAWWTRADRMTAARAKIYNIKYLLACLASIAARALERARELLLEGDTNEIAEMCDFVVELALRQLDSVNWGRPGANPDPWGRSATARS